MVVSFYFLILHKVFKLSYCACNLKKKLTFDTSLRKRVQVCKMLNSFSDLLKIIYENIGQQLL